MSNMRDAPVLKAVAVVVRDHVGNAFSFLQRRIDAIDSEIKSLPKPEKGEKGDKGDPGIGEPGPIGPVGPAGKDGIDIVGEPGPPGLVGKDGKDGAPGRDGKDGAQGNPGEKGIDGAAGRDGKDGEQGAKGLDGAAGKDGRDGIDGKNGADGINGKDGSNGINGKDAPAVDTDALSAAIFEKVLGAIPKPKDGLDGKDGASVDLDAVRILVAGEVNKAISALPKPAAGRDGRDGRNGEAGISGKDGAEIDPLPGIDESMAYQKGTWAAHRNGLIRAYRTTDPVTDGDLEAAGWQIIQNGIFEMHSALATDGRTLAITGIGTNGKAMPMQVKLYIPQYQGVWKEQPYDRGDYVTMAGSQWHANRMTKDRPGTSDAWTLAVKRGSDGKDLNGTKHER